MATNIPDLNSELNFSMSRSGGKGGQHVNKVSTKVDLVFDVRSSVLLSEYQKRRICEKLSSRISNEGLLRLECDSYRSQARNKEEAVNRFYALLEEALKVEKPRKKTRIPRSVKRKRLETKKRQSEKKSLRKKRNWKGEGR